MCTTLLRPGELSPDSYFYIRWLLLAHQHLPDDHKLYHVHGIGDGQQLWFNSIAGLSSSFVHIQSCSELESAA